MFSPVVFNSDNEQKNKRNLSAAMLSHNNNNTILGIIIHRLTFSPRPFANAIYKTTDIITYPSPPTYHDGRFAEQARDIVKRLN